MARSVVVVLGMHRGGTSAVARGLAALGVSLGDNLWGAKPENERGYWEDRDVYDLNEALLAALEEPWNSVRHYDTRRLDPPRLEALLARGRELLEAKLRAHGNYGFKDPRTSRLLFYWRRVFAAASAEPRYLIAARNPLSVARSLEKRNGLGDGHAYLLWMQHMLAALYGTEGRMRVVVDYDRLLQDPARELRRIREELLLPQPQDMAQLLDDYAANFLSGALRHTRFDAEAVAAAPGMPAAVLRLHRLLSELAEDRISPDARACVSEVRSLWAEAQEFGAAPGLAELLREEDQFFVETAYRTLLSRPPDAEGRDHYLGELRAGVPKLEILGRISGSAEAAARGVELPGLRDALKRYRRSRWPVLGRLFAGGNHDRAT
jgi:hypothetical protein